MRKLDRLARLIAAGILVFLGLAQAALATPIQSDIAPILSFFGAVREGDVDGVRKELSKGANPNAVDAKVEAPPQASLP